MKSVDGAPDRPKTPLESRWPYAARALRSAAFGALIGIGLALFRDQSIKYTLAYSLSIAMICWFCIDVGRRVTARWLQRRHGGDGSAGQWPGWAWMLPVLVVGTCAGFGGGIILGDWLTNGHSADLFSGGERREALALLLLSLTPAVGTTYFYRSRALLADGETAAHKAQLQAAESQRKLLESQLEPHMLFNTLANLRVLIDSDPARAQQMLDQLIAFLRATSSGSRSAYLPLREEFARLGDYLALIKVRMGDRLITRFDLPEALAAVPVPPLLLQPLVENSVKHGLETQVAGGRIEVSAARAGDELVLRVRDTGVGFQGIDADGSSFGLAHVRERLATLYGARATLSLSPAADADGGALAIIRLPLAPPH